MITTLIILALSTVFFINGKLRSDLVALCALVLLIVFNTLTLEEALSGFSNPTVVMMVELPAVGGAIFKTRLAKMISSKILRLAGKSELKLFILIMMITAFIGASVSNTDTVTFMLPIIVNVAVSTNINLGRFLVPLAFASNMGGMTTLIGMPPNLVVGEVLPNAGFTDLPFSSFTPIEVICVLIDLVVLIPLSKLFLVKREDGKDTKTTTRHSPKELAKKYQLSDNLYRIQIRPGSRIRGKRLQELNITQAYNLSVLEIRRQLSSQGRFLKTVDQSLAGPHTELQENDILHVFGPFEKVNQFAKKQNLEFMDTHVSEYVEGAEVEKLSVRETGIAEVLLMPDSKLINRMVEDSDFRDKYSMSISGTQWKGEYILNDIKNIEMHAGNILLIQGIWGNIIRMSQKQSQQVVLSQSLEEASKVILDYKTPVIALIMVSVIAAMVLDFIPIPPVAAVIIAGILMALTGCFRNVKEAYRMINQESVALIAVTLPISLALKRTGTSNLISEKLASGLGDYGPLVLMAGIHSATPLLTMFINNTVTAVPIAPIAPQSAIAINVSPYPLLLAVTVGASMYFASPFSIPSNALAMSVGKYTFMDYVKVGLLLRIVTGIAMVFISPLLFPFQTFAHVFQFYICSL